MLQDLAGQLTAKPTTASVYIARGSLTQVLATAGQDAKTDRTFADKVVIVGPVEQHVHPVLAALTTNTKVISIMDWDTLDGFSPAVRDPKSYQERLVTALAGHKDKSKPFITRGYHHYLHGDQMSRSLLDQIFYNFAITPWFQLGADLQWITPGQTAYDDALVGGLRANINF